MSKPRFSRAFVAASLEEYLSGARQSYRQAAKRDYDPMNGTAQVPKGNMDAMYYYGRIMAYKSIISEIQP